METKISYEELITEDGIFTSNIYLGLTANEVYEKWLYDKENPQPEELTLEDKISILTEENENLKQELALTQDAVNEMLFMMMNMEVQ